MSWVAVGATVAAAALTAYNQNQALKKQDQAVSQGILQRMQATRDASTQMQKTLATLRDSNAQPAVQQGQADYLKALTAAPPMLTSQPAQVGAMSDAYKQAAGVANDATTARADKTAGLMAVADAPALQRQGESVQIGNLSSTLQRLGIGANDQTAEAELKARGIRPNPWVGLVASALAGYGRGAAMNAGTAGTASAVDSPSSSGYFQNGGFAGGGNYTGPGSLSTDYTSNVKNLYGMGG